MIVDEEESQVSASELKNLEVLSIEALNEYITELELEIARVKKEIGAKERAKVGAEAVFKS